MSDSSPRSRSLFLPAFILALGLALGALVLSGPLRAYVKSRQIISVKGYAEQRVESDFAVWSATITTRGKEVKAAADAMDDATRAVTDFLVTHGVSKDAITLSDLTTTALSKSNDNYNPGAAELDGYKIDRRVSVTLVDLDNAPKLAAAAPDLLRSGLEISFNPVEYYCTKLSDIKITLLGQAVQDARRRADEIAGKTTRRIGDLRSASQGVFQITSPFQSETSDEGVFDTESRNKSVKAVVTAEFELR